MNYIAITGALHMMGQTQDRPQFPANLVGDFGGGSTYLVIGILAALLEAQDQRRGPGRRRGDRRRHRAPQRDDRRRSPPAAATRRNAAPTCSTAACRSTTSTRPPTASTCRSGRSSRSSSTRWSRCSGSRRPARARATWTGTTRCARSSPRPSSSGPRPEWVELFEGTDACVAGIVPISEAVAPPAPRGPRDLRRARGHGAAAAGAAVLPDRGEPRPAAAARSPGQHTRRGAGRVGDRATSRG